MDKDANDDPSEVMRQEKQRGRRRPIDFEAAKQRAQLLKDMRKLLETATEEEFRRYSGRRPARRLARVLGGAADLAGVPILATAPSSAARLSLRSSAGRLLKCLSRTAAKSSAAFSRPFFRSISIR